MIEFQEPNELETALLTVYRGPLEEFVSRRDAAEQALLHAQPEAQARCADVERARRDAEAV